MPAENTPGWAVEIRGEKIDLDDLRESLTVPFEPWVEDFEELEGVALLLRTNLWAGFEDGRLVGDHAKQLVDHINGAETLLIDDARAIEVGRILKFDDDGKLIPVVIAAAGDFKLRGARMRGRASVGTESSSEPLKPSPLQVLLSEAQGDDDTALILGYISKADNWYDIYKAAEVIRRKVGNKDEQKALFQADYDEWDRAWFTANSHRHPPRPKDAKPKHGHVNSTLEEGRAALLQATKKAFGL